MLRIQKSLATKVIVLAALITFLLTLYTTHPSSARLRDSFSDLFSVRLRSECTPEQWASGQWTRREPPRTSKQNVSSVADVLEFEGFEGCASDREYKWHLAAEDDQWDRFPEVAAYQWTPPPSCNVRQFNREAFVQDLVENGGWLLIGGEYALFVLPRIPPTGHDCLGYTLVANRHEKRHCHCISGSAAAVLLRSLGRAAYRMRCTSVIPCVKLALGRAAIFQGATFGCVSIFCGRSVRSAW